MSQRLYLYIQKRGTDEKMQFISYTSSTDEFQRFASMRSTPTGDGDKEHMEYGKIDKDFVEEMKEDIQDTIEKTELRISEYRLAAARNPSLVEDVIEDQRWLNGLKAELHRCECLERLVNECDEGYSDFDGVYANFEY